MVRSSELPHSICGRVATMVVEPTQLFQRGAKQAEVGHARTMSWQLCLISVAVRRAPRSRACAYLDERSFVSAGWCKFQG